MLNIHPDELDKEILNMQNITAEEIYHRVRNYMELAVKGQEFYLKTERYWRKISDQEFVRNIYGLFPEEQQAVLSDSRVREVVNRLRNTPVLQTVFVEEESDYFLNLKNGVYDLKTEKLLKEAKNMKFKYVLDFNYCKASIEKAPAFKKFVEDVFGEAVEEKQQLLLEVLGYCLSDFTMAKAGFFFIGASNSGKSTLFELLRKILPTESVTSIPLQRLGNKFSLARLDGARVNICSELAEDSLKQLDIFKMLTSSEMITAEHKGKSPFEFQMKCKSLNAGNFLPELKMVEGMDAILNRMIILLFPISVVREKQNLNLLTDLWQERDIIFSLAVDALVRLYKNDFIFTEPTDTKELKEQLWANSHIFEEFIKQCCVRDVKGKVHNVTLYEAFIKYCTENLCDVRITQSQFTQKLYRLSGVKRGRFRLCGSKALRGVEGLRLKERNEYYVCQDSEVSDKKDSLNIREQQKKEEKTKSVHWYGGTEKEI